MVSGFQQELTQKMLAELGGDERREWKSQAEELCEHLGQFAKLRTLDAVERGEFEKAVEVIVRIESIENGTGSIKRAFRRVQLLNQFMK